MQIDPRRLAVLGAVANAGGVLAAATVLHLTPSAVSQHIARLEADTGVVLLDRSRLGGRRAAGLTPAGRLLAAHAERLAETLATAERELAALTGQVTGPVSVGAFPTAIRHLVAPAATAVAATNPNIEVRIRQIEPEPGLAALHAGGLDLLIVEADPADPATNLPGLRAVRLLDDPYQIAFPKQWAPVAGVEALLARPWIDGPAGSAAHPAVAAARSTTALNSARPHVGQPVRRAPTVTVMRVVGALARRHESARPRRVFGNYGSGSFNGCHGRRRGSSGVWRSFRRV